MLSRTFLLSLTSKKSSSVEGEARVDLSKFRRDGPSVELWEKLHPIETETGAEKAATGSEGTAAELHLLITYCPTNQARDDLERESMKAAWFELKGVHRVVFRRQERI